MAASPISSAAQVLSQFIVLWPPDAGEPTPNSITAAVSKHLSRRIDVLEELDPADDDMPFTVAIHTGESDDGGCGLMVFWAEPAQPADDLPDEASASCEWVVGVMAILDDEYPMESWHDAMRLLAGAFSRSPAILDLAAAAWYTPRERDVLLEVGVPASNLWIIHAIEAEHGDRGVWLHTHGLSRFGVPELEMLEVPSENAEDAAELLDDIADLLLEEMSRGDGETPQELALGPNITVALRPWQEVVRTMDLAAAGSARDRNDGEEGHGGERLVVCDREQRGSFKRVWTWPEDALRRRAEAPLYRSRYTSERRGRVARATWPCFLQQFRETYGEGPAVLGDITRPRFYVQARLDDSLANNESSDVQQFWLRIVGASEDSAEAAVIDSPLLPPNIGKNDRITVAVGAIGDWRIAIDDDVIDPEPALFVDYDD